MEAFWFTSLLILINLSGKTLACLGTSQTIDLHDEKVKSEIYRTKGLQNLEVTFVGKQPGR